MARALTIAHLTSVLERLPLDRPFSAQEAALRDVGAWSLRRLVGERLLEVGPRGVYRLPGTTDTVETRLQCLALVIPADCVVTDLTAAWIWCGDRALPPNAHLDPLPLSVFAPPGRRLRNDLVDSGERRLVAADVVEVGGLLVTTPLRTACDLGRLLHADSAFAAMDVLASLRRFSVERLVEELRRFKRYRGIIQARQWAPWVDPGSDSWLESVARKRWIEASLPRPTCQCPVPAPTGGWFYVDFGLPEERFGCEVFGAEFHGDAQAAHDGARLAWLREGRDWTILVARNQHITGHHQDLDRTLRAAWAAHRAR